MQSSPHRHSRSGHWRDDNVPAARKDTHEKTLAQPDACDNPTSTITPIGDRVISVPRKRALLQEYGVLIQETASGDLFRFTGVPPHAFKSTINDHASAL